MKRVILSACLLAGGLGLMSCEKHSWEDRVDENGELKEQGVKRLYEGHGHGDEGHDQKGHAGEEHGAEKGE